MERGEVKGSLLDIKFEMPFRQPHGDAKQAAVYASVVFKEVGAGHVNLGIDGIKCRREMSLVTLVLCSPGSTGCDLRPHRADGWPSG